MNHSSNKNMEYLRTGHLKDNTRTFEQLEQFYSTKSKKTSVWSNTSIYGGSTSYGTSSKNMNNNKGYSSYSTGSYSSGSLGPCGWACP
jgi:hypothetical protein